MDTTPHRNDSVETLLKKILLLLAVPNAPTWGTLVGDIEAQEDLTTYITSLLAALGSPDITELNASTNPEFPAGEKRDLIYFSHAGKVGGPDGEAVEVGDCMVAKRDTAGGIAADWLILQTNMPGLTTIGAALATLPTPATDGIPRVNSNGTVSHLSLAFNEQVGTTYTMVATDAGKTIRCTNDDPIAFTIPDNDTVPFPLLTTIEICQGGVGKITIGGAGVTIECPATEKRTTAQHAGATLKKRGTNTWWLEGRLE